MQHQMLHNAAHLGAKTSKKEPVEFHCDKCDYTTSKIGNWKRHIETKKHNAAQMLHNDAQKGAKRSENGARVCECGKSYKHHQSFYRHKAKCKWKPPEENIVISPSPKSGITKDDVVDIVEAITPIMVKAISGGSTISGSGSNNTINNQNVNINLFLNEQCADAMSIQGFTKQLSLTIADLLKGSKPTSIGGVSNIVIENLKPIPITERPMHCIDVDKRRWHVKDAVEGWKEEDGESIINHAELNVCKKFHDLWEQTHPNWCKDERLKSQYTELMIALNTNPTSSEIEKALKRIGPTCKLSLDEITSLVKQ